MKVLCAEPGARDLVPSCPKVGPVSAELEWFGPRGWRLKGRGPGGEASKNKCASNGGVITGPKAGGIPGCRTGAEGCLAEETTAPGRPSVVFVPGAKLSPRGLPGVVVPPVHGAGGAGPLVVECLGGEGTESPASVPAPPTPLGSGTRQRQGLRSDVTTGLPKKAAPSQ